MTSHVEKYSMQRPRVVSTTKFRGCVHNPKLTQTFVVISGLLLIDRVHTDLLSDFRLLHFERVHQRLNGRVHNLLRQQQATGDPR